MQGRLGCWGLVPNLYFVSLEKWRGKNANNVPLSPPLRLFEVKIRFTSDSWKPIRGICLKGGEKLGVGWRILSAALIDVTPKSRRNLKSAAVQVRELEDVRVAIAFISRGDARSSYVRERELHRGSIVRVAVTPEEDRIQSSVRRPLPSPNSPSGEFRFPAAAAAAAVRTKKNATDSAVINLAAKKDAYVT